MTVYRITTANTIEFGRPPKATLTPCESDESNMVWVDQEDWITPAGWEVCKTISGQLQLYDPAGAAAELMYQGTAFVMLHAKRN